MTATDQTVATPGAAAPTPPRQARRHAGLRPGEPAQHPPHGAPVDLRALFPASDRVAVHRVDQEQRRPVQHLRLRFRAFVRAVHQHRSRLHHPERHLPPVGAQHADLRRGGAIGASLLATMAGYAFAKYRFPGAMVMFSVVLGAIMIPLTALALPTYLMFSSDRDHEHRRGGHRAVAGESVRCVPDAGLRRGRDPGLDDRSRHGLTAPASSASSGRWVSGCSARESSPCSCSRWSAPGTTTSCR